MNKKTHTFRGLFLGLALALLLHAVPAGAPAQDNADNATQASEDEAAGMVLPDEAVLTVAYCAESIGEWQPCPS